MRSYFARQALTMPIEKQFVITKFKVRRSWRIFAGDTLRRLRCLIFGHRPTVDIWMGMGKDGHAASERHHGCTRCPLFWTEPIDRRE